MSLNFQFEWMDPAGARGPELRATWARLELVVEGRRVTRAVDELSRGVRDSVYLPLYPLAEWSVTQWWFLQYEIERRDASASTEYTSRHSLRSAAEGLRELRELKLTAVHQAWSGRPWAQGYRFTRELRTHLGLDGAHIESLGSLGKALQVHGSKLESAIIPLLKGSAGFDAVVDVNAKASPTFAVVQRNERSTLFSVCRAIFEYLVAQDDDPQVVTRSHSDRQKRNRAFAAEFIVPAEQLRLLISSAVLTNDDVDDLAERLNASAAVIRHQIENHRLATVVD